MKFVITIAIIVIIVGITWYFGFYNIGSIPTPQSFKDRLSEINEQFDNTKRNFEEGIMDEKTYKKSLEDLLEKQEKLYFDVKNYIWSESQTTEYNSWFRGIMKFPSNMEQEYQKYFK